MIQIPFHVGISGTSMARYRNLTTKRKRKVQAVDEISQTCAFKSHTRLDYSSP
jgi:hypothetical protein